MQREPVQPRTADAWLFEDGSDWPLTLDQRDTLLAADLIYGPCDLCRETEDQYIENDSSYSNWYCLGEIYHFEPCADRKQIDHILKETGTWVPETEGG